jgi:UDP-N-acetylmuramoylalanine--D-glutamate ligase
VALGVDNKKIVDFFSPILPVVSTSSLSECLDRCRSLATEGDTVLLSPCCASFDLFKSYVDRGNQFKAQVKALSDNK